MRRISVPFALVTLLVAAVALADSDRVAVQFEALSASGISGEVRLNPMQQGGTRIQSHIANLEPSTEYVSLLFQEGGCTTGGVSTELARFTSNPAGIAVYNVLATQEISAIGSISVQLASDPAVLACATVTP
jgi:hypothetical protein